MSSVDAASMTSVGLLPLIGRTPLVELTKFDTGPCELFVKLESQNPGGSIKDRIGLAMIEAAERAGALAPGRDARRGDGRQHGARRWRWWRRARATGWCSSSPTR